MFRRTAAFLASLSALTLGALVVVLLPASPADACTGIRNQQYPSGYCQMPVPDNATPSPTPSPTECRLDIVTWKPSYLAWGMDGDGKQGVDVFSIPESTVTLTGYERPSTEVRVLGTKETNRDGYANFPVHLQGSTRVFATSDAELCADEKTTDVAVIQARLGALTAHRHGPRDYSFTTFYAGPSGKIGNLYRVTSDGREVLTSQTRMRGEWATIRRVFLGSGRFGFVLRSGDDVNSLGASTNVRDTVIH